MGADINERATSYEEINRRITAGNKCYISLVLLFIFKLLSIRKKVRHTKL